MVNDILTMKYSKLFLNIFLVKLKNSIKEKIPKINNEQIRTILLLINKKVNINNKIDVKNLFLNSVLIIFLRNFF